MKFSFDAIDDAGRRFAEILEADDMPTAVMALQRRGLHIVEIAPVQEAAAKRAARAGAGFTLPATRGRLLKDVAGMARSLHVLLVSGATLPDGLAALERQAADQRFADTLRAIHRRLEDGVSFVDALREHPETFDGVALGLVAAGESSGKLPEMLARLGKLAQKELSVRRQIISALTYPLMVLAVGLNVVAMLMWVVLPRFAELFESMQTPLPPSTSILIGVSDALRDGWWAALPALIVLVALGFVLARSPAGARFIHRLMVRTPVMGGAVRGVICARIARVLGVLLAAKVDLLESLRLTRGTLSNTIYIDLLDKAERQAEQGATLSSAFADASLIPPSMYEALRTGEDTGATDQLLLTVADFMDEDNEVLLRSLLNILGPAILAVLGVIVGGVALSLFVPLFDLTSATPGGGGSP